MSLNREKKTMQGSLARSPSDISQMKKSAQGHHSRNMSVDIDREDVRGLISSKFQMKTVLKPGDLDYEIAVEPTCSDKGYLYEEGDRLRHIVTEKCGEVRFFGSDKMPKPFAVVSDDSHPGKIRHMMESEWGLSSPDLLISVTGGAQGFKSPNSKLEETFRRAIMRAAMRTNAWITTGGTDSGVMELVGKAVNDYGSNVPVVGIGAWGTVTHQESFAAASLTETSVYKKSVPNGATNVSPDPNHTHFIYVDNGTKGKWGGEIALRAKIERAITNPAFPWIDSGERVGLADGNARWKMRDAPATHKEVAEGKYHLVEPDRSSAIPSVCMCYEGGPGTVNTVYSSIRQNIPVVVVEASGRISDVLVMAHFHWKKVANLASRAGVADIHDLVKQMIEIGDVKLTNDMSLSADIALFNEIQALKTDVINQEWKVLRTRDAMGKRAEKEQAQRHVDQLKEDTIALEHRGCAAVEKFYKDTMGSFTAKDEKLVQKIMYCVRQQDRKGRLKVGAVTKDDSVDKVEEIILYTILKGQNMSLADQLHLTITWNQPGLAEKFVLRNIEEVDNLDKTDQFLNEALHFALLMDREVFVELLLDSGADIHSIDLDLLYKQVCFPSKSVTMNALGTLDYIPQLFMHCMAHSGPIKVKEESKEALQNRRRSIVDSAPSPKGRFRTMATDLLEDICDINPRHTMTAQSMAALAASSITSSPHSSVVGGSVIGGSYSKDPQRDRLSYVVIFEVGDHNCLLHRALSRKLRFSMTGMGQSDGKDCLCTYEDALVWSTLCGRYELSELLWRKVSDPIVGAVVSANIFQLLSRDVSLGLSSEQRATLQKYSDDFEKLSVDLLDACTLVDLEMTSEVLEMKWPGSKQTPVDIAAMGDNKDFVAHIAPQNVLKRRFMGSLNFRTHVWFNILLGILVPLYIGVLPFHHPVDQYGILRKIKRFYEAPATRFILSVLAYCGFLVVYSIVVLAPFEDMNGTLVGVAGEGRHFSYSSDAKAPTMSSYERFLMVYFATFILEEFKHFMEAGGDFVQRREIYLSSIYNKADVTIISLYVSFVICRILGEPLWARFFLSIGAIPSFLRLLHAGRSHEFVGPLLVVVQDMFNDALSFLFILILSIISFGIALEGLGHPLGSGDISWNMFGNIFAHSTWRVFGDLFMADLECSTKLFDASLQSDTVAPTVAPTGAPTAATHAHPSRFLFVASSGGSGTATGARRQVSNTDIMWDKTYGPQTCIPELKDYSDATFAARGVSNVLVFAYMIFTNVLLVNLLVAMMTDTYARVKGVSYQTWRMEYYKLLEEYSSEQFHLPPPFSLFTYPWRICRFLAKRKTSIFSVFHQNRVSAVVSDGMTDAQRSDDWMRRQQRAFMKDCQHKMISRKASDKESATNQVVRNTSEETLKLKQQMHDMAEEIHVIKKALKASKLSEHTEMLRDIKRLLEHNKDI